MDHQRLIPDAQRSPTGSDADVVLPLPPVPSQGLRCLRCRCCPAVPTPHVRLTWRGAAIAAGLAVLATVLVLSVVPDSPLQTAELEFLEYVQNDLDKGSAAGVFVAAGAVFVVLGLPATPLNLAGGFILGGVLATAACVAGITIGAIVGFVLGRTAMKHWAEERARKHRKFAAISTAVAEKGFLLVFLLRLSPVMPLGLCNYLLGVTKVSFTVYSIASFLGIAPFTAGYCYLGTLISDLSSGSDYNPLDSNVATIVWASIAGVSTVAIIIVTAWITKKALNKAIDAESSSTDLEDRSSAATYEHLTSPDASKGEPELDLEEGPVPPPILPTSPLLSEAERKQHQ
eukprot:m51a1_g12434 putative snare associated golgi family protein (344) ;mRNA; f:829092-830529